jgi:sugar phosphate permease
MTGTGHRWRIFGVLALMYILAYFYRISLAVVAKDLSAELGLSAIQLGTLSGVFFYVYAVVQIPLGPLLDRFGGRLVISVFGLLSSTGGFLFALAPGYGAALGGRVLIGIGTACVLMGSLKIFTSWFTRQEFAAVSGYMVAVGNLGNLTATAPLALSVAAVGWRTSFLAVAAVQTLVTFLVFGFVRDTPSRHHAHPTGDDTAPGPGMVASWRTILTDRTFWLLGILSFFWYGNYIVLQGLWGGPYLMEAVGMDRTGAGRVLLFTSLGFITGCLSLGRVTERLFKSKKRTLLAGQTLLLCLMTLMLGPAEVLPRPVLYGAFFAIGVGVSSGVTIYSFVREMFPVKIIATALTSLNFFVLMGAASVQHLMGYVIEQFPKSTAGYPPEAYHTAFLLPIGGLLLAILLFTRAREPGKERT